MRMLVVMLLLLTGCMDEALATSGPPVRTRYRNRNSFALPGNAFPNSMSFNPNGPYAPRPADPLEYLESVDAVWNSLPNNFTLCMWTRAASYDSDDTWMMKYTEPGAHNEWAWIVGSASQNFSAAATCAESPGTNRCTQDVTSTLVDGTHYFICAVVDLPNVTLNNRVRFYQDGVQQISSCTAGIPTALLDCADTFLSVGRGYSIHSFVGYEDEITIWGISLTTNQVNQLCCGSTSCPAGCRYINQAGQGIGSLIAYWRFDGDSTAGGATDSSGNGHTLTSVGLEGDEFSNGVP